MSGPTLHHRAIGIHPAAFVQDHAPSTADVQDHVLWIDTSTLEPYQLKMWDALAGVWRVVGSVSGTPSAPVPGAPGQAGRTLTLTPQGTKLIPEWQPCCADGTIQPTGPVLAPRRNQRCGAAVAMATALEQIYESTRTQADYAYTTATVNNIANWVTALGQIFEAQLTTGLIALAKPTIVSMVANFQAAGNISFYPPLTTTQKDIIQKSAYCALTGGAGIFTVTVDTLDVWRDTLQDNASHFVYNQLPLLLQLMAMAPPQGWETIAYVGAQQPSNVCDMYICKLGTSLTGGALLGGSGRSLSGGATIASGGFSLRGGAQLTSPKTSLSGGAFT